MIVRIQDIRDAGFCCRGARIWAKESGWDFKHFLQHGIAIERLDENGDHFCVTVAAYVRNKNKEVNDGQE